MIKRVFSSFTVPSDITVIKKCFPNSTYVRLVSGVPSVLKQKEGRFHWFSLLRCEGHNGQGYKTLQDALHGSAQVWQLESIADLIEWLTQIEAKQ